MSKKLLTVKEWAEKYCEWYGNKEVYLSPSEIIDQINKENLNNIENKIPSVRDLNDLYLKIDDGEYFYGGNIFEIISDDNLLPNEDDAVASNFIPISFLYCNIDEIECPCPVDGDELICNGTGTGGIGDDSWCDGTGTGADGDDPWCDGTGTGVDGDELICDGIGGNSDDCGEDESF